MTVNRIISEFSQKCFKFLSDEEYQHSSYLVGGTILEDSFFKLSSNLLSSSLKNSRCLARPSEVSSNKDHTHIQAFTKVS